MLRSTAIRKITVGLIAAAVLAAGCGSDETPPPVDAPATQDVVTTTTTEPPPSEEEPSVCEDPASEDLGSGFYQRDSLVYELVDGDCVLRPTRPGGSDPETAPEPEAPADPETAAQPEDDEGHDDEGHEYVPGFEEVEPLPQGVTCGEGLVLMEQFITGTDNGCRPETCEGDRAADGECALVERELTDEDTAALPTETIPYDEYGLEGCTQVSPGTCDLDGVLHCYDTVDGWAECPGQPTGDPCEHDASDPLSFVGSLQTTDEFPQLMLDAGVWRVDACLRGNNVTTGAPSRFVVSLMTPINEDGMSRGGQIFDVASATDGEWTAEIEISADAATATWELFVTPEGSGSWVVQFSPVE